MERQIPDAFRPVNPAARSVMSGRHKMYFYKSSSDSLFTCSTVANWRIWGKMKLNELERQKLSCYRSSVSRGSMHSYYNLTKRGTYLPSTLNTYQTSCSLGSSDKKLVKVPRINLNYCGYRSFSYQAPTVWNSLPSGLRQSPSLSSFKSNLKTYPFQNSFHASTFR